MFFFGYNDIYLECNLELYWFGKVAVVGSPLGFMVSIARGSWFTVPRMNYRLLSRP